MGSLVKYLGILSLAGSSVLLALTLFAEEKGLEGAKERGYCGDGFINGNEDCDGSDIKIPSCKALNGGEGRIKCQPNCVYDISECGIGQSFSDAVDQRLGGLTEVCKCTCNNDNCQGGCAPIGDVGAGRTDCLFRCDNSCTCDCEGRMESRMEYSNITCQCDVDTQGNPQCYCSMDEMEMLVGTSPRIGQLTTIPSIPFLSGRGPLELPLIGSPVDPYTGGPILPPPPSPNK